MTYPARAEQVIQRAVFEHLRMRAAPGVFAFHVPNGGYRTPTEAAIMQGLGVKAGVPDVIVIKDDRTYGLELKAEGGRATAQQLETATAREAAGAHCAIAVGLDRAVDWLEAWGILRGRSGKKGVHQWMQLPLLHVCPISPIPDTPAGLADAFARRMARAARGGDVDDSAGQCNRLSARRNEPCLPPDSSSEVRQSRLPRRIDLLRTEFRRDEGVVLYLRR